MTNSLQQRLAGWTERFFVERELFLRADGRVRYLKVSRKFQVSAAAAVVVALGWVAYASVSVVFHHQIVASRDGEIERQRLAYLDLLGEVSGYHEQFTQITHNLEQNQDYLLSLLARRSDNEDELAKLRKQLKQSEDERARVILARDGLRQRMAAFEDEMSRRVGGSIKLQARLTEVAALLAPSDVEAAEVEAARRVVTARLARIEQELDKVATSKDSLERTATALDQKLASSEASRRELLDSQSTLQANVAQLEQQIGQANARQSALSGQVAALEMLLGEASSRTQNVVAERDTLQTRITGLEHRLVEMRHTQQAMVDRLSERTLVSIDSFERTVAMTGLDVEKLLDESGNANVGDAQGGPFIPGDFVVEQDPLQSLQASIALLDLQMDRWETLQDVVRTMPLAAPLDQFRVTSTFGKRRDPVNNRVSRHYGLDLAAPTHTPVMNTAPGKVVFAGWKGRYGRVIVVDHGHGIRTRYAHLRKILVKVGEEVAHRQKIGLVGSSGRSTGPHVHYEVQVNGRPVDPMNFLKAGKHVFKG